MVVEFFKNSTFFILSFLFSQANIYIYNFLWCVPDKIIVFGPSGQKWFYLGTATCWWGRWWSSSNSQCYLYYPFFLSLYVNSGFSNKHMGCFCQQHHFLLLEDKNAILRGLPFSYFISCSKSKYIFWKYRKYIFYYLIYEMLQSP